MRLAVPMWLLIPLAAGALLSAQTKAPAPRSTSAPVASAAKGAVAPPVAARASELDRWDKMTPVERQKVLDRLPVDRRKRLEEKFQMYSSLSPVEQQKLRQEYSRFRLMPPARQEVLRKLYKEFEQLPPVRRDQLRTEMQRLGKMSARDRRTRLASADFRTKYTLSEQRLIQDLLRNLPQS